MKRNVLFPVVLWVLAALLAVLGVYQLVAGQATGRPDAIIAAAVIAYFGYVVWLGRAMPPPPRRRHV